MNEIFQSGRFLEVPGLLICLIGQLDGSDGLPVGEVSSALSVAQLFFGGGIGSGTQGYKPGSDAFTAALAKEKNAELLRGHQEFKALEKEIKIHWLKER
ncbi:MAG: type II toxin-antitoxin system VapC family toxin [Verrucomicrobia bacterium]|nr:MAG: type II toxin-antitoxin system VapC family toxin [Verrucomicrobiota bacterium]